MPRVSLIAALGLAGIASASLAGCATAPKTWARVDGRPADPAQLQVDQTVCRGEMEKARLSEKEEKIYIAEENPLDTVFAGCMAQRGYLAAK
jgi:hypothetical protein